MKRKRPIFQWALQLTNILFYFGSQHLFPDADKDLEDLEIAQQELLFEKMENKKEANCEGPQV